MEEQEELTTASKPPVIEATIVSKTIEKPTKPVPDFKLKLRKFKASIDSMLPFFQKFWKGILFIVLGLWLYLFTKNWIVLAALLVIGVVFMANPNFKMNDNIKIS